MASAIPPLDTAARLWKLATVQRLIKITSFLLLAIWLPATLHCDLEAAGLADPHHADCCAEANDCKTDLCATIESSLIRESAPTFNLAAPADCDGFLYLATFLAYTCERLAEPSLSPACQAPPLELAAGWQFFTRAAPLSRAPSLLPA